MTANGTYYLFVEDILGNSSKKEFTVKSIDNKPPTIQLASANTKSKVEKSVGIQVVVNAKDDESGIALIAIDNNSKIQKNGFCGFDVF